MNTRFFFVAFLLLSFALPSQAITIDTSDQIIANTPWMMRIEFGLLDSYHSAVLAVDGQKLLTLYSNNQTVIDPFNEPKVLKSSAFDKQWFTTLNGFSPGSHVLTIETFSQDNQLIASESKTLSFVDPLGSSFNQSMVDQLNALKQENESLATRVDATQEQNQVLTEQVQRYQSQLQTQQEELARVSSLNESLRQQQSRQSTLAENLNRQLQEIRQQVLALEPASNRGLGFWGILQSSWLWVLGLLLLIGVAGFWLYRKRQMNSYQ